MPIKLSKPRNAPAPAPLVERSAVGKEPVAEVFVSPRPKPAAPSGYEQRPVAKTAEEHSQNLSTMKAPAPTICTFCKHAYCFPCNGLNDRCMNAEFVRAHGGAAKNTGG